MPGKQTDQFVAPDADLGHSSPAGSPAPESSEPETAAGEVEYPCWDGRPIADNMYQEVANSHATIMLTHHLRRRKDVLVANNLLVYYVENDPTKRVVPDVMVALGVRGGHRMSYLVWEEGKAPDFVLEVASPLTVEEDLKEKPPLYARLGVREFFRYDPIGNLLPVRLYGARLVGGRFNPLRAERLPGAGLSIHSEVLGLDLRFDEAGERLRMWDPVEREYLLTPKETRAETVRLQRETARLRRERLRIQDETVRLRHETARARAETAGLEDEAAGARKETEQRQRETHGQCNASNARVVLDEELRRSQ